MKCPIKASTVVLVKEEACSSIKIYVTRRSLESSFMPGLFVFPGGAVEPWDSDELLWERALDEPPHRALERVGRGLPADDARGHSVAAIRETLEEAGILLCSEAPSEQKRSLFLSKGSNSFGDGGKWFRDLVLRTGVRLSVSRLLPWSHWITPEERPKRFDTRFFLVVMSSEETCTPDDREVTEGLWVSPEEALFKNQNGTLPLSPPTLVTLHELGILGSSGIKEILSRATDWGEPRIPRLIRTPSGPMLIMPWDPQYHQPAPEGFPLGGKHEKISPFSKFSRLLYCGGLWTPVGN